MPASAPFTPYGNQTEPVAASRLRQQRRLDGGLDLCREMALRQPTPATITASPKSIA